MTPPLSQGGCSRFRWCQAPADIGHAIRAPPPTRPAGLAAFEAALGEAFAADGSTLIVMRQNAPIGEAFAADGSTLIVMRQKEREHRLGRGRLEDVDGLEAIVIIMPFLADA